MYGDNPTGDPLVPFAKTFAFCYLEKNISCTPQNDTVFTVSMESIENAENVEDCYFETWNDRFGTYNKLMNEGSI